MSIHREAWMLSYILKYLHCTKTAYKDKKVKQKMFDERKKEETKHVKLQFNIAKKIMI